MGISESKSNSQANLPNNINENQNTQFNKEAFYNNMANYLNFNQLKIIEKQKENSVCKIIKINI